MGNAHDENVSVSFTRLEYDVLDYKMERMLKAEFDDIDKDRKESMSVEDRVGRKVMVETTTLKNGHYQIWPAIETRPTAPSRQLTHRKKKIRISEIKGAARSRVSREVKWALNWK